MLSRRGFLLGSATTALLAACGGGDDDDDASPTTTSTTAAPDGLVLGEAFDRNGLLLAGVPQRAPFVLFQQSGGLVDLADAPTSITFTASLEGGDALGPVPTARRGDDVDRPYYPLAITFPEPGDWTLSADLGGGTTLESLVRVNASVEIPQLGGPIPTAPTPTTAAPLGATHLCTRQPACPFHEVSLDAAVAGGEPVAVLISTPQYCQVGICGPVLDLLVNAAPAHPDIAFVHIEVYTEGTSSDPGPVSPLVTDTFHLQYEPALFVAGADGVLTARLDNIYDSVELGEALASATA